jgi:hypothetical protein
MSTAIKEIKAAAEKKRSVPKKRIILVEDIDVVVLEEPKVVPPQQSIWMQLHRMPKATTPIIWEGIEDISDDEDDTPQAAGRRLSQLKATRDRIQRNYYGNRLEDLKDAGLFLNW